MDQLVSRLLLYGDLGEEAILSKLAALFQAWKEVVCPADLVQAHYPGQGAAGPGDRVWF
ncbi:MAG: hypothetical protein ACLS43_11295 [Evtepia gabavorous]